MNFEQNKLTQFGSILLTCLFLNGCNAKREYSKPTNNEFTNTISINSRLINFGKKNKEVCVTHKLPEECQKTRLGLYKYYLQEFYRTQEIKLRGQDRLCDLVEKHYMNQAICDQIKTIRKQDSHRKDVILEVLDESIKALEDGAILPNDEGKLDNVGIETFSPSQIPTQK